MPNEECCESCGSEMSKDLGDLIESDLCAVCAWFLIQECRRIFNGVELNFPHRWGQERGEA